VCAFAYGKGRLDWLENNMEACQYYKNETFKNTHTQESHCENEELNVGK
jgi:hypothetical protein